MKVPNGLNSKSNIQFARRRVLGAGAGAMLLTGLGSAATFVTGNAGAQVLPRTLRIVVAYPAGGVGDVVARAIADKLATQLGCAVIVENRAGASGTIGMDAVAKATPDGATLGFSAISPLVLSPHLGKLPYDPRKDVLPVASVMVSPVVLFATSATATRTFQTLLDDARARPGAVRWATSGQASLGHIMLEQLRADGKFDVTHVPYKGGGQQINDAISGQFEILSINAGPLTTPFIQSGKLRPLAVGAPARLESLPQVPTLAELGFPAANMSSRFGFFAPAGTPDLLVTRYNIEINKALASPDVRARLVNTGNVPTGGSASDFADVIAAEYETNGRIVRTAAIKAD